MYQVLLIKYWSSDYYQKSFYGLELNWRVTEGPQEFQTRFIEVYLSRIVKNGVIYLGVYKFTIIWYIKIITGSKMNNIYWLLAHFNVIPVTLVVSDESINHCYYEGIGINL